MIICAFGFEKNGRKSSFFRSGFHQIILKSSQKKTAMTFKAFVSGTLNLKIIESFPVAMTVLRVTNIITAKIRILAAIKSVKVSFFAFIFWGTPHRLFLVLRETIFGVRV